MSTRPIPALEERDGALTLLVDGIPFLILGGELHNSSGSDLGYLKKRVWPALKEIGGNCYLTPVYWEEMEPEPGVFDFTLVDGVIAQAREEGLRLVLLWFGLWKNGQSQYVPAWMKKDPSFFYLRDIHGVLRESVSPFCGAAIERDRQAFVRLMEHLREVDRQRTVIMIQVENETGAWGAIRDCCPAAEEAYEKAVPEEVCSLYPGTPEGLSWEEAFGKAAGERFMAWAYATAVERIAAAGSAAYPLPMFMNLVPVESGIPDEVLPSGGPIVRLQPIWRCFAPTIRLYGPDVYSPNYREVADAYAAQGALLVPELSQDKHAAAKVLYSAGAHNLICFSPFGIEGMCEPLAEQELLSQMNTDLIHPSPESGALLGCAYRCISSLWQELARARKEGRAFAFLEQGKAAEDGEREKACFLAGAYDITVTYGDGGIVGHMGQPGHRREDGPIGGGFILQRDEDTFLLCGIACNFAFAPKRAEENVFITEKRELFITEEGLTPGRNLNGDERNYLVIGSRPQVIELKLYRREN